MGVQEAVTEILRGAEAETLPGGAVAAEALRARGAVHRAVERGGQVRREEARPVREGWKALLGRRTARVDCAVADATHVA